MIQITNLTKKYNGKKILNKLNLNINNENINIIIGENGKGKTTLIKCINQLIRYDGQITNNHSITYMPEKINLPENIIVKDFLNLIIKTKNKLRNINIEYYYHKFKLIDHLNKKIKELSLGTKQKIIIIQTLIDDSDIYIFDEPLNSLDSEMIDCFIEEIQNLYLDKKLIIIISHDYYRIKLTNINLIKI